MNPYVWLRDESCFSDANKIIPERWLRDGKGSRAASRTSVHPYVLNPFSIGTRMCAGKFNCYFELFDKIC